MFISEYKCKIASPWRAIYQYKFEVIFNKPSTVQPDIIEPDIAKHDMYFTMFCNNHNNENFQSKLFQSSYPISTKIFFLITK